MHLTQDSARALMLAATGLGRRPARIARKTDVLECIRRMGVLQIDTIHVVARSPYLVLWSRLGAYRTAWLDELLAEGAIFECWAHEASFLPAEAYPLYRSLQLHGLGRAQRYFASWVAEHRDLIDALVARVRAEGAVRSSDFERTDGRRGAWWDWKAEKLALEALFASGDLMIARRQNFQRVYDLRERVRPDWDDSAALPVEAVRRAQALAAVRALGVAPARWVADYFRTSKTETARLVRALAAEGALLLASVEGWAEPAFLHPDRRELAEQAAAGQLRPRLTTLLSPFDPLVWDRARALELFGFDYRIECYTPAPKRRYGYFTLPILRRGQLVGRLDPKAHRREGVFEVRALHLEPGVRPTAGLVRDLAGALRDCAAWHATPEVTVRASDPPELADAVRRELASAPETEAEAEI